MGNLSNNINHPYGRIITSEDEVKEVFRSVEGKKYHCDEIQSSILVKVSDVISPVLSNIFNKCILSVVYPDILKWARAVPIFAFGDSNLASNYRPISTLSVFNKVFEKLIHARLSEFLSINNDISDTQFFIWLWTY